MTRRHFPHRQKLHVLVHASRIGRLDGIVEGRGDHKSGDVERWHRERQELLVVKVVGVGGSVPGTWDGELALAGVVIAAVIIY